MRTGRRRLIGAVLAMSMLAATGCGKSAKPLTRAQLLTRADAICRELNKKLSSHTIKTRQDFVRTLPLLAGYEQQGLAALSKLVPPAPMANDWKLIVAGAQTLADDIAKLGESIKAKDNKTTQSVVNEIGKVQQRTMAIAKRDGFKDCSQVA
jgi:hypothetical protein